MAIVVAACSSDTPPVPPSDPQASAALLKKDCEDPMLCRPHFMTARAFAVIRFLVGR
jgi:hypothetical protein